MSELSAYCEELGRKARAAARLLATASGGRKDRWLRASADALEARAAEILDANARDLAGARDAGLNAASIDRLRLTPERLTGMAAGLREVAALPDPIGRVLDSRVRPNGLEVQKIGVPLGVIFFIYESRPNVTTDAAGLCVKSGNAIILRGGKEAMHSNTALAAVIQDQLRAAESAARRRAAGGDHRPRGGRPPAAAESVIDLAIPRGGESLIRRVAEEARMPVLKHYKGNCHVYVDRRPTWTWRSASSLNAKCQRPGVCNAAESLLVHQDVAETIPAEGRRGAATSAGVELRGCEQTRRLVPDATPATEADFAAEFLDLILSVKVVAGIDEAIEHIGRYGSQHTEAIITNDLSAARKFTAAVDSSAVLVNASTRFNDGFELGLGAEIGISTDKLHARGPCGLVELTSYKYVVYGDGQVRG